MAKIIFVALFIYAFISMIEKQGMRGVKEAILSVAVFWVLLAMAAAIMVAIWYVVS